MKGGRMHEEGRSYAQAVHREEGMGFLYGKRRLRCQGENIGGRGRNLRHWKLMSNGSRDV